MQKPTKIIILDEKVDRDLMDFPSKERQVSDNTIGRIHNLIFRRRTKSGKDISLGFYESKKLYNSYIYKIENHLGEVIVELTKENIEKGDEVYDFFTFLSMYIYEDSLDGLSKTLDCKGFYELISGLIGGKLGVDSKRNSKTFGAEIDTNAFNVESINEEDLDSFTFGDIFLLTKDIDIENKTNIKDTRLNLDIFSYIKPHFAFYLGNGYFISKYGSWNKLAISSYGDLISLYSHNYIFRLSKKEF